MAAVLLRVRSLGRTELRGMLFLALVAGLAGGLILSSWSAARRAGTVVDRFADAVASPDLQVAFCTPGEAVADGGCAGNYDGDADLRAIQAMPEVEKAGRASAVVVQAQIGDGPPTLGVVGVTIDDAFTTFAGTPKMVEGRRANPEAVDEVVIDEALRDSADMQVGDRIPIRLYKASQYDVASEGREPARGASMKLHVVGVARTPDDLSRVEDTGGEVTANSPPTVTPAWWRKYGGDVANYGILMAVRSREGDTTATQAAIARQWADRDVFTEVQGRADMTAVRDTVGYEAKATFAFAIALLLAAFAFVGPAVARQAQRDAAEHGPLAAIGFTRPQSITVGVLRAAGIGIVAAMISAIIAIGSSVFTPIGIARQAEPDLGLRIDRFVLVVGLPLLVLSGMAIAGVTTWSATRRRATRARRTAVIPRPTALPAPVSVGVDMALGSGRGGTGISLTTALLGTALAAAVAVGGIALQSSLRHVVTTPKAFGVTWDLTVGDIASPEQAREAEQQVHDLRQAVDASAFDTTEVSIDGHDANVVWFRPVADRPGHIGPVIASGRSPRPGEIALGRTLMRDLGVQEGDTVDVRLRNTAERAAETHPLLVVGTAIVNDAEELEAGDGGVVPFDWVREAGAETRPSGFVVRVDHRLDPAQARAEIKEAFPFSTVEPRLPRGLRNLERIDRLPSLLLGLVSLLAAGALAHALFIALGRRRREFAVLKSIGFTRAQVSTTVAALATSVAGVALLIGLPLGLIGGRILWNLLAENLGVVSGPIVPRFAPLAIAVVAIVVVNLLAIAPGWLAARTATAETLRTE